MNHNHHEYSLSVLYICLKNFAVIMIFLYLAFRFQIWWLVLFAVIFQSSVKTAIPSKEYFEASHVEISNVLTCKICGEILIVSDIENAVHREMKLNHWRRIEVAGKWWNVCPHCVDKYFVSRKDNFTGE